MATRASVKPRWITHREVAGLVAARGRWRLIPSPRLPLPGRGPGNGFATPAKRICIS